ncbi:MAG: hypothetical protein MUO67_19945 [Anaerolineales bacterium]|nr:hypothetical protein [Anaerolineales bacterium]
MKRFFGILSTYDGKKLKDSFPILDTLLSHQYFLQKREGFYKGIMKINFLAIIFILLPLCSSCSIFNNGPSYEDGETDGRVGPEGSSGFGSIIFCENVTEDGVIIGASNNFPEGTNVVWAYFNYWGMENGQPWGRLWTHDGREYINAQGEIWEDFKEGWVAYSIGGDFILESGTYELTLFVNNVPIQRSSFQIGNQ